MIAAQQLGMTLRNASTSKQAKPYHLDIPCNGRAASAKKNQSDGHETSEANVLYLMNVAVNQGFRGLIPMDAAVKTGSKKGLHWIS
jgi:hypothetical protein